MTTETRTVYGRRTAGGCVGLCCGWNCCQSCASGVDSLSVAGGLACNGNCAQYSYEVPVCSFTAWSDWSACAGENGKTCGKGKQKQTRTLTNNYGNNCSPYPLIQERECNLPACPPCVYGEWQDTSTCAKCGDNLTKTQKRSATDNGANDCNQPTTQTVSCGVPTCPSCNYGAWSDWSACSKVCDGGSGPGKQTRTRTQDPKDPLNEKITCGDTSETQFCNKDKCAPCEYNTEIDEKSVSTCSVACGGGTQSYSYAVKNNNHNDSCPPKTNSRECNTQLCATILKNIQPKYTEYWDVYLSNDYNSASNFTSNDYSKLELNRLSIYKINNGNLEDFRDKLVVGMFPLDIDVNNVTFPFTMYYYFTNPKSNIAKITVANKTVNLQLNNNPNDFGNILNAIHINSNGTASVVSSKLYFLQTDTDFLKHDIYMIINKKPMIVQPKMLLSCTSNAGSNCMTNRLGKNLAITFTINMKDSNHSNNYLQILGITTDPTGIEKCVFGAWVCPKTNNLYLRRADREGTSGVFSECDISIDVGNECQFHILCNGSTNTYDVYKNGALWYSFDVTSPPLYVSETSYIYTSFKNYNTFDGTLSNVAFLTSDHRTFTVNDLNNAVKYMNSDFNFSILEKKILEGFAGSYSSSPKKLEGFVGNYSASPNGSYAPSDLRNMERELIQEMNEYNREYANYKKYMYNNRHNVSGDTTAKFSPVGPTDFPNLNLNIPLEKNVIYQNLSNDLNKFNNALQTSVNLKTITGVDVNSIQQEESNIVETRKKMDHKLKELTEIENNLAYDSMNNMNSTIYANILWTVAATSLIYFIFVHRNRTN